MQPPKSVRDVRAFNGLANFYGKFVPHFADIMKPLYRLTQKDVSFHWSPDCQKAFLLVKEAMRNDISLHAFDWSKDVVLETDASDAAYAEIISQPDENGDLRPVLMFSHTFTAHEINWSAHDKELFAIVYAFDRYRHFLEGTRNPSRSFPTTEPLAIS